VITPSKPELPIKSISSNNQTKYSDAVATKACMNEEIEDNGIPAWSFLMLGARLYKLENKS
jgi:hypothetical protein